MRKLIIGLVMAVFVISSCENNTIDEGVSFSNKMIPVTIKAEQVDESVTKTIRNLDKSVSWMPSDEIAIFIGTEKAKFTSTNTENELTASFNGELSESTVNSINNGTNTNPVWGLYPYDDNATCDGSYVTTTLPSQQTGVAGTFADDLFITLAQSTNFNLYFYNVCSGFKFSVTKEGVTSITLKGNNNEDIAGKVKLSFVDGKPKAEVVEGEKTITLVPEGSTVEVGKDYYFVILPTEFTQGFTVSLNTMSQTGRFTYTNSVDFPRSKFVNKSNVDDSIEFVAIEGNVHIPDANFKSYLVQNFDKSNDGEISYAEASLIEHINCENKNIETLSGIEYFHNLKTLLCNQNQLTNLDVSKNTALTELQCIRNNLSSLDVSKNIALSVLYCDENNISSIDVSNNLSLTDLGCEYNQLTSLVVCNNIAIKELYCNHNQLSSLDVSNNPELINLFCENNQIRSLDISENTSLAILSCKGNAISSLNVSKSLGLKDLRCGSNQLSNLDVSKNTSLIYLFCEHNQLCTLEVGNNTKLEYLYCYNNLLTSIDVSSNSILKRLYCENNRLTSLDVSYNTLIEELNCDNNILSALDISNNTALRQLYCSENQINSLDVSNNTLLETLSCDHNQLSKLDVSSNGLLKRLYCDNNQLSGLDVSNNAGLLFLRCTSNPELAELLLNQGQTIDELLYDSSITTIKYKNIVNIPDANFKAYLVENFDKNKDGEISYTEAEDILTISVDTQNISTLTGIESCPNLETLICSCAIVDPVYQKGLLTSLDVSHNTALRLLECCNNQLTTIDIRNNAQLSSLNCNNNQLTTLDISNNELLTKLNCSYNQLSSLVLGDSVSLSDLDCSNNQLTNLNTTGYTSLGSLNCSRNQLTSLLICDSDAFIDCSYNCLTELVLNDYTGIIDLNCSGNQLTYLSVSGCTSLKRLEFHQGHGYSDNPIRVLDVSGCSSLKNLSDRDGDSKDYLTDLNIRGCSSLTYFSINSNLLSEVCFDGCKKLIDVYVSGLFDTIDLSNCSSLESLYCSGNNLASINVLGCSQLIELVFSSTKLISLDVSTNLALELLAITNNPLLKEVWLKTGQTIKSISYDSSVTTIKYKD